MRLRQQLFPYPHLLAVKNRQRPQIDNPAHDVALQRRIRLITRSRNRQLYKIIARRRSLCQASIPALTLPNACPARFSETRPTEGVAFVSDAVWGPCVG